MEQRAIKWMDRTVFNLRELNREKPITYLKLRNPAMKWPKVLREVFATIWREKASRIILKGPRGGGKSQLVGALGFCLWFLKERAIVDMGGSLEQAKKVYSYFLEHIDASGGLKSFLEKDPTITETSSEKRIPFKCVTASPKQVRGPHVDALFIDEACEARDELIKDAMPMVNTSEHSLIMMTSTFHKIFGIFQETWDKAPELGYMRFSWDVFDVCKPFSEKIWDDPTFNREIRDLKNLKELAKGRTGDPQGWIPILNIIQAWREKPTLDWFLVEYMGMRPSAAGLVLNPEDVDACTFDDKIEKCYNLIKNAERIIGIDWGFSSMTSVTDWMRGPSDLRILIHNSNYVQVDSETIIKEVIKRVKVGGHRFIYADSAGKFENVSLRNALKKERLACKVIEVVFSTEKEFMLGNLRAHFQQHRVRIPIKFADAIWQYKRYRYQEGTDKPIKKDDHIPDSTMCAFQHWPINKQAIHLVKQREDKTDKTITGGLLREDF